MTIPTGQLIWSAPLLPSGVANLGDCMVPSADGTAYTLATAAARGTRRSEGIAITPFSGIPGQVGSCQIQMAGTIDASLSGLGTGTASWVRCSALGRAERFTPVNAGTSDVIGWCETDGRLHLLFGQWTETILVASATFIPPTGTGFATVTAGVLDVASKPGNASGGPLIAPAALVVGDMYYAASMSALARIPKGADGSFFKMVSGLPAWVFDPASLALSGYFKGYLSSPWAGTASAGTSGANSASSATPPLTSSQDGNSTALLNGSSQYLGGAAGDMSTYVSASGFLMGALVRATSLVADPGAGLRYGATPIFGDSTTFINMGLTTTGPVICGYDGAYKDNIATVSNPVNTWIAVFAWRDSSNLFVQANNGTPVSVACGAIQSLTGSMQIGRRAATYFTGQIAEVVSATSNQGSTVAQIYAAWKAKYPTAGLP